MTTGARYQPYARQPHARVTARGAETRNRLGRPLRERLYAGEPTAFWGPAGAGDRDGTSVAERRARGRFARGGLRRRRPRRAAPQRCRHGPVPPVGGDGYGRG